MGLVARDVRRLTDKYGNVFVMVIKTRQIVCGAESLSGNICSKYPYKNSCRCAIHGGMLTQLKTNEEYDAQTEKT